MTSASVLVTGGNGFIGRHLVRRLLHDGCAVTLLQRSPERIDPRTELLRVDSLTSQTMAVALEGRHFDWLFHLAAAGVQPDDCDPEAMFQINVDVTRALMSIAARWPLRAVIIAGSGSEYRLDGVRHPVAEDWPLEPYKLYGASKAAGTLCAAAFAAARGIPFAACRLFGVYGPGEAAHRLLPALASGLRSGKRVALSHGLQKRDFVFVDDAVEALVKTTLFLEKQPQQLILNVGTGRPVSVRMFAKTVAAMLAAPLSQLGFGDIAMPTPGVTVFSAEATKLRALTGWVPMVQLRDGIRRYLDARGADEPTPAEQL